ncbi:uncharacterized protein TNCV_1429181 [Trichonephila clavipes]|nr:uncharacterized protein TNCV_1429181 [Trichonephila clavipes]
MLDVTKYPPSAHGFTCRNCGGGDRGRVAIYRPFGEVSLSLNRTVTCMVLKANDRRTSCPCHDEFRGPRSDYVRQCSQLASLDKNNALPEIKLRLSYLQGKSTTMSVIAHQTEKEWISANEKSRQRMSQTQPEGTAEQHAARLEDAHLRAHHSCFTTSERC